MSEAHFFHSDIFLNPHKIFFSTSNFTIASLKHALKPENLKDMHSLSIRNRGIVSIEKIQKVFGQTDVRNDIHQKNFFFQFFSLILFLSSPNNFFSLSHGTSVRRYA